MEGTGIDPRMPLPNQQKTQPVKTGRVTNPRRFLLVTAAVLVAVLCGLVVVSRLGGWPPAESPPRQGEALDAPALRNHRVIHAQLALSRLIREPQNAWSNLAFVVGGAWLISGAASRAARAVGIPLIGVGIGSFLYHASASRVLRHLDVAAMYWLFLAALALSFMGLMPRIREFVETHTRFLGATALILAVVAAAGRNVTVMGVKPFALTIVTAVTAGVVALSLAVVGWRRRTGQVVGRVLATFAIFAAAVVCQIGDRPGGWLCDPDALLQAHAAWHILSAIAFTMAVMLLDSSMETAAGRNLRQTT